MKLTSTPVFLLSLLGIAVPIALVGCGSEAPPLLGTGGTGGYVTVPETGGSASGGALSSGGTVGVGGSSGGTGGLATGGVGTGGSVDHPPPLTSGCDGYATRFWDCCKPHCGWNDNVPDQMQVMKTCSSSDAPLGDQMAGSSCGNSPGPAHTCYDMAPWAVSDTLAYGYAASQGGDICGRCYQIQFKGTSHNAGDDPGSAALNGKTMIVQLINIGYDVAGGQFDLLIPGGGVGAFNGCSNQWGVDNSQLGQQYGGFMATCKSQSGSYEQAKTCVRDKCASVFGSRGLTELEEGCNWYLDWFEGADNPNFLYKEVTCPAALTATSGMDRTNMNDVSNSCGG